MPRAHLHSACMPEPGCWGQIMWVKPSLGARSQQPQSMARCTPIPFSHVPKVHGAALGAHSGLWGHVPTQRASQGEGGRFLTRRTDGGSKIPAYSRRCERRKDLLGPKSVPRPSGSLCTLSGTQLPAPSQTSWHHLCTQSLLLSGVWNSTRAQTLCLTFPLM